MTTDEIKQLIRDEVRELIGPLRELTQEVNRNLKLLAEQVVDLNLGLEGRPSRVLMAEGDNHVEIKEAIETGDFQTAYDLIQDRVHNDPDARDPFSEGDDGDDVLSAEDYEGVALARSFDGGRPMLTQGLAGGFGAFDRRGEHSGELVEGEAAREFHRLLAEARASQAEPVHDVDGDDKGLRRDEYIGTPPRW